MNNAVTKISTINYEMFLFHIYSDKLKTYEYIRPQNRERTFLTMMPRPLEPVNAKNIGDGAP